MATLPKYTRSVNTRMRPHARMPRHSTLCVHVRVCAARMRMLTRVHKLPKPDKRRHKRHCALGVRSQEDECKWRAAGKRAKTSPQDILKEEAKREMTEAVAKKHAGAALSRLLKKWQSAKKAVETKGSPARWPTNRPVTNKPTNKPTWRPTAIPGLAWR